MKNNKYKRSNANFCGANGDYNHHCGEKVTIQICKAILDKVNAVKLVLKKRHLSNEKISLLALDSLIDKFNDKERSVYDYIIEDDDQNQH